MNWIGAQFGACRPYEPRNDKSSNKGRVLMLEGLNA